MLGVLIFRRGKSGPKNKIDMERVTSELNKTEEGLSGAWRLQEGTHPQGPPSGRACAGRAALGGKAQGVQPGGRGRLVHTTASVWGLALLDL